MLWRLNIPVASDDPNLFSSWILAVDRSQQECVLKMIQTSGVYVCVNSTHTHWEVHTQQTHMLLHILIHIHTIVGTELSDLVRSAGSLLSQSGFPWLDFKGKIQLKTPFTSSSTGTNPEPYTQAGIDKNIQFMPKNDTLGSHLGNFTCKWLISFGKSNLCWLNIHFYFRLPRDMLQGILIWHTYTHTVYILYIHICIYSEQSQNLKSLKMGSSGIYGVLASIGLSFCRRILKSINHH